MAHHIENGMISFNGATPWHGLGTRVDEGASPEEMLHAAKLDWSVELRSLAVSTDCAYTDDAGQLQTKAAWRANPMAAFKAVVRTDTNECFGVPSKKYNPVQNIEVARFFVDYSDATSCKIKVVGALDGGKKVWALAEVGTDYIISAPDAGWGVTTDNTPDRQLGYVLLATSHDGSLRTIAMGTSIYVVCWNTMSAALGRVMSGKNKLRKDSPSCFALKHSAKFDDSAKKQAIQTVGLVKEQLQSTHAMAEQFAKIDLDSRGRIEFVRRLIGGESVLEQIARDRDAMATGSSLLDSIVDDNAVSGKMPEDTRLGKQLIESIISSPGNHIATRANTLWGAVNGVTHYVDHQRGRTTDSTLNQAWFGQGANLKADAINVAYDMAGLRSR